MPVSMTREEYRKKYGADPVLPSKSTVDTTPAPRRMTRAEYEAEYGPKESFTGNVGQRFNERADNVGQALRRDQGALHTGLQVFGQGIAALGDVAFEGVKALTPDFIEKPIGEAVSSAVQGVANTEPAKQATGWYQQFKTAHPTAAADLEALFNIGSVLPIGKGATLAGQVAKTAGTKAVGTVKQANKARIAAREPKMVAAIEEELFNIENNYVTTRRANDFSNDAGYSSRRRIAETDVLANATDTDGKIRTMGPGGAVEKYRTLDRGGWSIDGVENTVRVNLERLGETVNLDQVKRGMTAAVTHSGLEGADLFAALNGIKREIAGLKLRADEFGNIPLVKVHDAKISTTRNINFQTPPETAAYRKAIARAYKELVEDNSKFNVKEVNTELAKYYKDLEHLERLDGKGVKGRKLGKYFAQISGNIIGGATGSAVGGPIGAAIGTIAGGEAAALIKGRQMAGTFGKARGATPPKNPILEVAREQGQLPKTPDLRVPDKKVGAASSVPKTKEIHKIERAIEKNVQQQKAAIRAGDFTLVAMLKEVYNELVAALKEAIKKIKTEGQKGFIKNPFSDGQSSNKNGSRKTQYNKTPAAKSNTIDATIAQNTVNADKAVPNPTNGAWPDTTASKPSKAAPTGIGRQPGAKGGTSAVTAGTWDPFDGPAPFKGFTDITTKTLEDLKGRTTVSKQYILDATNRPDLKQAERDLIRRVLQDEGDTINVADFAKKVKSELLPLKRGGGGNKYENVTLPNNLRGPVANYSDHIYSSPIKTSAGDVHFAPDFGDAEYGAASGAKNYFAHTRIEDLPSNIAKDNDAFKGTSEYDPDFNTKYPGNTRRVIEIQSDLFQKGRLDNELPYKGFRNGDNIKKTTDDVNFRVEKGTMSREDADNFIQMEKDAYAKLESRDKELNKLEPYKNTWWERVVREEVKQAAKDGKTKLQFPVGETAMKIEGLGSTENWVKPRSSGGYDRVSPDELKVGMEVSQGRDPVNDNWIITDVLGDGKFKAVQKNRVDADLAYFNETDGTTKGLKKLPDGNYYQPNDAETFDISGKVDTNSPIYRFYEKDLGKYLTNKLQAKRVKDERGVEWWEVNVSKVAAKAPVEAFGVGVGTAIAAEEADRQK